MGWLKDYMGDTGLKITATALIPKWDYSPETAKITLSSLLTALEEELWLGNCTSSEHCISKKLWTKRGQSRL